MIIDKNTTPAMAQFIKLKEAHKDYLLFYRMGDFYEMFFEDAINASKALDIALTKRGKNNGEDIPLCGVPYHACESYLHRLIKQGFKVAICEQTETPEEAKKRGYKAVVNREVVRLVTAGTLTEDNLLETKSNNFILSINKHKNELGFAWVDISTGDFFLNTVTCTNKETDILATNISRINPAEIILSDELLSTRGNLDFFSTMKEKLVVLPLARFSHNNAQTTLQNYFKVQSLDCFGSFNNAEISCAGVILDYLQTTQKDNNFILQAPIKILNQDFIEMDIATQKSLELTQTTTGNLKGSLLSVMDYTQTSAGGRLLKNWLNFPLSNITKINQRLEQVEFLVDNKETNQELRSLLKNLPDISRAVSRLSLNRGGPRDLANIAKTLSNIPQIKHILNQKLNVFENSIKNIIEELGLDNGLSKKISSALKEELPMLARDGGFIKEGYFAPLDELYKIKTNSHNILMQLQERYAQETNISNLKIKFNNVIGYFIEVPTKFGTQMLENPIYIHRQSVLNAARFTTVELTELENNIRGASDKILAQELEIYNNLVIEVLAQSIELSKKANALAHLDVISSLATLAIKNNYTKPVLDNSFDFNIIGGRHPVVEEAISTSNFIKNDCTLGQESSLLWLLTGPNMAGKSTFLRQNAIIAIMAQIGSYVPCDSAKIGIINKVFSRVGASDELLRGRSTFMVEMIETASILNQADERSFVILDEIGRGTATYDGLSIAWAVVEHLINKNKSRGIFATHYHELTELSKKMPELTLHCMKVKEYNEEIIFMHEVINGSADRSYGVHVAKLAGLPNIAIKRAEQILNGLENNPKNKTIANISDELPLFASIKEPEKTESKADKFIKTLNPDDYSPKEALEVLYKLKELNK
ncbi:MAG: DNA mismatch repair protein MutS [Alphaproteobacteria bacterium]